MKKQIALIGFGTIGQYLFRQLRSQDDIEITGVYEANPETAKTVPDNLAISSPAELEKLLSNVEYADMVVFSTTAFADEEFESKALELCSKFSRKIYVPHGAILGLDGIRDGREKLESVMITTIKKPANLGRTETERTVLFEGPTREACRLYPRNVNVHASIAIAGLGFDKTKSRIIADPDSEGNVHIIEIAAEGVKFKIEICSIPLGRFILMIFRPITS
ncbi:MAG: nadX [Firmicutes bacterium]|nr:nadX [Bacillota bacterium]